MLHLCQCFRHITPRGLVSFIFQESEWEGFSGRTLANEHRSVLGQLTPVFGFSNFMSDFLYHVTALLAFHAAFLRMHSFKEPSPWSLQTRLPLTVLLIVERYPPIF